MKNVLEELLGKLIEVRSESNYRDDGHLVAYDDHWIKLEKPSGEVLYLTIANVRLLKPVK